MKELVGVLLILLALFGSVAVTASAVHTFRDSQESIPKSPARAWTLYQEAVDYEMKIVATEKARHNVALGLQKNP